MKISIEIHIVYKVGGGYVCGGVGSSGNGGIGGVWLI